MTALASDKGYIIDASSLINLLGGKNPNALTKFLTKMVKSVRLVAPAAVLPVAP